MSLPDWYTGAWRIVHGACGWVWWRLHSSPSRPGYTRVVPTRKKSNTPAHGWCEDIPWSWYYSPRCSNRLHRNGSHRALWPGRSGDHLLFAHKSKLFRPAMGGESSQQAAQLSRYPWPAIFTHAGAAGRSEPATVVDCIHCRMDCKSLGCAAFSYRRGTLLPGSL